MGEKCDGLRVKSVNGVADEGGTGSNLPYDRGSDMALICSRHSFEYAENVCSSCGSAFCHDCLVYPRGPKKPPLCVPCAIAASGVRSSARNPSNLSRREVKKRVKEAKGLQQPQPYVEAPVAANPDRDFELTSNASFDQGWAVSWDEGRDPHPGYPEPVRGSSVMGSSAGIFRFMFTPGH